MIRIAPIILMSSLLLSSLTWSSLTWAENPCLPPAHPSIGIDPDLLKTLEKAAKNEHEKSAYGASDADVLKSRCSRTIPFTEKEMSDWLDSQTKRNEKRVSRKVAGIDLVDESPYLSDLLDTLLTNDKRFNEPQKTYSSACKKAACVAKELFGERAGLQLLFMLGRFGYNGSHLRVANADPWSSEELDTVLLSLSDLPEELISTAPLAFNHPLVHFKREKEAEIPKNKQAFANEKIYVFGLWDHPSPSSRRYFLFHELGHNAGTNLKLDNSASWYQAAGWNQAGKDWNLSNHDLAISKYSESDPAEDFAESFAAYRYNPEGLKKTNPDVYQLLKSQAFNNREYTSDQACQNPFPESPEAISALKDLKAALSRTAPLLPNNVIDQAKRECVRDQADQLIHVSARCISHYEIKAATEKASALKGVSASLLSEALYPPSGNTSATPIPCSKNCRRLVQNVLSDIGRALNQELKLVPFDIKKRRYPVPTYCNEWSNALPATLLQTGTKVCRAIQSRYRERQPMSSDQIQTALQKIYSNAM